MGISIHQFSSTISSHDNFVKTKDTLACFKDHFWNIMLMMFYIMQNAIVFCKMYLQFSDY